MENQPINSYKERTTRLEQASCEPPSYNEIIERFGEEITLDEAVEATSKIQREHPNMIAIGSVLASSQVYGHKDIRNTSRGLDFASPLDEIEDMSEEFEEFWPYDSSWVFSSAEEFGEEYMIAVIPCNEGFCADEDLNDFSIDYFNIEHPEIVSTKYGDIKALEPEIGITSKLRRYKMQKKNRSEFKRSDLVDVANILLNSREGDLDLDERQIENHYDRMVGEELGRDELLDDILDSIYEEGVENKLSQNEIESIMRETRQIF